MQFLPNAILNALYTFYLICNRRVANAVTTMPYYCYYVMLYYTCQSKSEAVHNTRPWQLISSANYYLLLTTLVSGQHKTPWRSDNR